MPQAILDASMFSEMNYIAYTGSTEGGNLTSSSGGLRGMIGVAH